ncbi:MAG: hypothetical protein IJM51_01690 [Clostridia bacterium]|nr:hypothetical protein [Clostridia bacterium]
MSNPKLFFKNFTAGRKVLFKRMLVYLGVSLAVFETANIFLEDGAVAKWCEGIALGSTNLKSLLTNVFLYLGAGMIIALLRQSSFTRYCMNIVGSDVKIEIALGDIFSNKGETVIPCNTTFSCSRQVIFGRSIQTQMTERLRLTEDSAAGITNDEYLESVTREVLSGEDFAKRRLEGQKTLAGRTYDIYEYGTMVPLTLPIDGKARNVILLAVAEMLAPDKPKTDGQLLMKSIDDMWEQIAQNRIREQTLVVPILGTGSAGITDKPQQTVARYILRSFADNAHRLGIKKLVLSVWPQDYLDDKINMEELRCYADYLCRFPDSDFNIN